MSTQVAKSSGNNTNPSGRRMQMSLGGGSGGATAKSTKDDSSGSRNVESSPATSKNLENQVNDSKSAGTGNKNLTNVEVKTNEKGSNVAKQENGTTEKKTTTSGPSNRRTMSQSSTSGNETSNKNEEKSEKRTNSENSRQKETRNKIEKKMNESNSSNTEGDPVIVIDDDVDDKVDNKKPESEKKIENKNQPNNGESIKNDVKQQVPENSKNRSRPNTPKSKSKDGKQTPVILLKQLPMGDKQQRNGQKDSQTGPVNSDALLIPEGDDMESLMFDVDVEESGSKPLETSTPGKVLKYKKRPPLVADKKMEKKDPEPPSPKQSQQPSVSEKKPLTSSPTKVDGNRPQSTFSSSTSPTPFRSISGRRSIRPLKEYSFQSSLYRETYRKINTELDCTTSSMNVTVGSERLNDESRSSFSFFGRGRKRERTPPPSSNYSSGTIETGAVDPEFSPKRARLDLSAFFGFVSSPVTMLTSRFMRTKVDCSGTPNGKVSKDKVDDSCVVHSEEQSEDDQEQQTGVENVATAGGSSIEIGTSAVTFEGNKSINEEMIETVDDGAVTSKIVPTDGNKSSEVDKMNISGDGNQESVQEMEQDEIKNAEGPILLKEDKEGRIQEQDTVGKRRLCRIM